MIEAIVLSNSVPDTVDSWQQAIDTTGYGLELSTAIPIESLDGYVSARWRKNPTERNHMKSGFECRHLSKVIASKEQDFDKPDTEYLHAFALGWGEDPLAHITVHIAAAAYATATNGIVLLRHQAYSSPGDILSKIRANDEYGYLPRIQGLGTRPTKTIGRGV